MSELLLSQFAAYANVLTDYSERISPIMIGKKYKPPFELVDKDTYVGIEIEVERVFRTSGVLLLEGDESFSEAHVWNNVEDGSLRNNGREFVSLPLKGNDILFALDFLETTLKKEKNCIAHEFTDRTSVHVHMNVRDLTMEQIKSLILTYIVVEPLLYSFVGGDRSKNIFCVPITDASLTETLNYILTTTEHRRFLSGIGDWLKYTGFNLLPILSYGTVEFRHMLGTCSAKGLGTWINILLSMKKYATKYPFEKIKETIFNMNTSSEYHGFMADIFGDLLQEFPNIDYSTILEPTTTFVKDVFVFNKIKVKPTFLEIDYTTEKANVLSLPFFEAARKQGIITPVNIKLMIAELNEYIKAREKHILMLNKNVSDIKSSKISEKHKSNELEHPLFEIERYTKQIEEAKVKLAAYASGEALIKESINEEEVPDFEPSPRDAIVGRPRRIDIDAASVRINTFNGVFNVSTAVTDIMDDPDF
jgi:hypothetical protein